MERIDRDTGHGDFRGKTISKFTPQMDVDEQVNAPENSMIRVKASQIKPESRTSYDKATEIYIVVPAKALPMEVELYVRRMDKNSNL